MKFHKNTIALLILIACVLFLASDFEFTPKKIENQSTQLINSDSSYTTEEASLFSYPFGIKTPDSLIVISDKIKRNQTLSAIFLAQGLPLQLIHQVVQSTKKVLDLRSLNVRKPYHFYFSSDSVRTPKYFIYEESIRDYIKVEFGETIEVKKGVRESHFVDETVAGTIESSLYASLSENRVDVQLAYEISDVFAWQVDFYRIQKGDTYQIMYSKEYVDDEPTGVFVIKAAKFKQAGESYYAFRFNEKGVSRYYDEEGNTLEKTFLKAPLKFSRVSSRYTKNRFHPVLKKYRAHLGTDFAAPKGTPVYSVADGVIEEATYTSNNGNYVRIRHNSVYESGYLHFSRIASNMKKGKKVKQGQVIGYVGDTGLATGPHVCYRFWKNGIQVDPYRQFNPSAKPIDKELEKSYKAYIKPIKKRLDKMGQTSSDTNILATL